MIIVTNPQDVSEGNPPPGIHTVKVSFSYTVPKLVCVEVIVYHFWN